MDEPARKKPVGKFLVPFELGRLALFAPGRPAAQVNTEPDARPVHDPHRASQVIGRAIDVLMQVNDAVLRSPLGGSSLNVGHGL